MKTVYLVTGACGHLGNTIIRKLLKRGCIVRGFALPLDKNKKIVDASVEMVYGDISSLSDLERFFHFEEEVERIVIHTAGIISIASKYDAYVQKINVEGTKNTVKMCEKYHVKRLVYTSSVHAIPEKAKSERITEVNHFSPDTVHGLYAQTKAEATQVVLDAAKKGLNACVVHPSGIIGPYDYGKGHLTQLIIDYMKSHLTACVNGGYDFVDVRDVADAVLTCCEKGKSGECYILSNRYVTVKELLERVHTITGKKAIKTVLPMWFAKLTAPAAELYYKLLKQPPLYTAYSLYTLDSNSYFSHEKATLALDYHPRDINETLRDTIKWLKIKKRI